MKKNSDTPKLCEFCRFAEPISEDDFMQCSRKGKVNKEDSCRKFIYDPLKRVPRRLPELIVPEDL